MGSNKRVDGIDDLLIGAISRFVLPRKICDALWGGGSVLCVEKFDYKLLYPNFGSVSEST